MPTTQVLKVDPAVVQPIDVEPAARIIAAGGLIAFPTETVYGLGANALDSEAVQRIFKAKGRPASNPVIVHVVDRTAAQTLTSDWPHKATKLADAFWPGPLTLVLQKADCVPNAVTGGGPTVAIRVPAHPVAQSLIRASGLPLAAPSANRSTQISPTSAAHVLKGLDGRIDMVLDGGPTAGGVESTVLDLTSHPPRLLRPGLVTAAEIEAVLGQTIVQETAHHGPGTVARSPGLMARHYAPSVPVECVDSLSERIASLLGSGLHVGCLAFESDRVTRHPLLTAIAMPNDAARYASRFYAALHQLEDARVERILVSTPPDTADWFAIRDRLRRAATSVD